MTQVFITVLNMSITASIVALAVMLVRVPLKIAPKVFSYALWGVVILRLVLPFSIESVLSLMPATTNIIPIDIATSNMGTGLGDTQGGMADIGTMPIIRQAAESNLIVNVVVIAGYVWLFGFILLLVHAVLGYISLKRRVRFATLVHDNIYETDNIKTPFVLGLICPKIYFPTTIDPQTHDYILRHEQIHIQRRDYIIKPFAYVVFALHWFNPLMWVAYFLMSKDMEMSCDEAVLRKTEVDIRRDYSMSLLGLSVKRVSLLSPIAFASGESNVKARISNVLRFKRAARRVTVASVIAVSVFLVGFSSDRILVTTAGANSGTLAEPATFDIDATDWDTNRHGEPVADHELSREISMYILGKYFSAFSHDWESWGTPFSLSAHYSEVDMHGDPVEPWIIGRACESIEGARFFSPAMMFFIDAHTGVLDTVHYFPPTTDYIPTSYTPLAISIEEAYEIYGYGWHWPLTHRELCSNYLGTLKDFTLARLGESGFPTDAVTHIDNSVGANFVNGFINVNIYVTFVNGTSAHLSFWAFDTHFAVSEVSIFF